MKPLPRGCLIDFSVSGKERDVNCFGACGLHALPRVVFHDFGRTSWWWKFQLSFSESDTSVACDLTELTPLVPPCSHKWFTIDWHERLPVKWSMVSTCGCTSKGVCQKDGTEQNSCHQMQIKTVQCTACCIVVTVTGNCLFVTLAPSSVQSDLDKATTCLYCIKT